MINGFSKVVNSKKQLCYTQIVSAEAKLCIEYDAVMVKVILKRYVQ